MDLDTDERLQVLEYIVATLARAVGMERDVYMNIVEQAAQSVWLEKENNDEDRTH
jgi:hypothetical protein